MMSQGSPESLRRSGFGYLFTATAVSSIGDRLSYVVLPFLVLGSGHSVEIVALVLGARSVAYGFVVLAGGVLADRSAPRVVLGMSDLLRAGAQGGALVALVALPPAASISLLVASMIVYGAAEGVAHPASRALVPALVPPSQLERANGYLSIVSTAGFLIGPALASGLVAAGRAHLALGLDALSFVASAVCVLLIGDRHPIVADLPVKDPLVQAFTDGLRAVARIRWLLWVVAVGVVLHVFALPAIYALGPTYAAAALGGAAGWGVLVSVFGVGGVLGGLLASRVHVRRPPFFFMIFLVPVAAQPLFLTSGLPFAAVAALQMLAGASLSLMNLSDDIGIQRGVPPQLVGRVSSFGLFTSTISLPLGYVLVALQVDVVGTRSAMVLSGTIATGIALLGLIAPSVRAATVRPDGVGDVEKRGSDS